jgi:hypothetical protein
VFPNSIWRHSHIRLTPEQFASAQTLIEVAAKPSTVPGTGTSRPHG